MKSAQSLTPSAASFVTARFSIVFFCFVVVQTKFPASNRFRQKIIVQLSYFKEFYASLADEPA